MLAEQLRRDLARYITLLKQRFGDELASVVLFGSHARGQARPESDIDVFLVIRGLPRNRFDRYTGFRDMARSVSEEFGERIATIVMTPEEAAHVKPYYLGMLSGHVVLYDREDFFAGVLEKLRRRLADLGSRRYVDEDGYEYWDLKPDWKPGDVVEL